VPIKGIMLTPWGLGCKPWPPGADTATAQGIGGARSGRASGGTPAKPGFRRSRKCARIILCKEKHYNCFKAVLASSVLLGKTPRLVHGGTSDPRHPASGLRPGRTCKFTWRNCLRNASKRSRKCVICAKCKRQNQIRKADLRPLRVHPQNPSPAWFCPQSPVFSAVENAPK
jgi:hypothetical protein